MSVKSATMAELLNERQVREIVRLHNAGLLTIDVLKRICAQDEVRLRRHDVLPEYLAYAIAEKLGVL